MHYHAQFEIFDDTIIIRFADFPEAISEASTLAEARKAAQELLADTIAFRLQEGEALPEATANCGEMIRLSAQAGTKIAVLQAFYASGISKTELANRLGKKEGEARRILDPWHATKLSMLEQALEALGQRLVITIEAAE